MPFNSIRNWLKGTCLELLEEVIYLLISWYGICRWNLFIFYHFLSFPHFKKIFYDYVSYLLCKILSSSFLVRNLKCRENMLMNLRKMQLLWRYYLLFFFCRWIFHSFLFISKYALAKEVLFFSIVLLFLTSLIKFEP